MNAPLPLPALDDIRQHEDEMVAIRRQIHANPELAYEEHATSELVAERLQRWGYEVHRGLGGTGVVGTLRVGTSNRHIGLRADMDALPIGETSGKPWASKVLGKMHACGHDGHTAMLLAAARHLAATRRFDGHLHLVFQPAEEGLAGAKRMLDDGFLTLFPCEAMFGMHNMPGMPEGRFSIVPGFAMASSDSCFITVRGKGGHGAMPHVAVDPVVAASSIVMALQTIVSRNVAPLEMGVVTVGAFHAGDAPNVIPGEATLKLTVRAFKPQVRDLLEQRITEIAQTQAAVYGASAEVQYQRRYPVLYNNPEQSAFCERVVREWRGDEGLIAHSEPVTGSEDFAFFLEQVPGCYVFIGNGVGEQGGCMVHNPAYDFNDRVLPTGASYWVRIAETYLKALPALIAAMAMGKKRSSGNDGGESTRTTGKSASKSETPGALAPEPAPFVLTLRDIEVPRPPTDSADPVDSGLVMSDLERQPEPYLGDPDADRAEQRAARRAQVRRERQDATTLDEPATPQMLVVSADEAACAELCSLLRGFGFGVQVMVQPPALPAPWPFVAVFVTMPATPDGGDTIELCNQVRESSRLPGERKPVLVLAAQQLSATDRVRAGLAGCHEILLGPATRGAVAQLLDARGITLPSDARRS